MSLQEIKAIAKQRGIDCRRMRKDELLRSIQKAEGDSDCLGSADRSNRGDGCLKLIFQTTASPQLGE